MKSYTRRVFFTLLLLLSVYTVMDASDGNGIDTGVTAWMLTSTALVLLMIPGLAMFYGGLVRSKNVLGTIMHSFVAMGVMSVLWVFVSYSMCFGPNVLGGWIGWNPDFVMLRGIDESILDAGVPEYVFSMFQGKFAIITPALIAGAFAERVSFRAYIAFIALWGLLVYNPLCHWVWAEDGFLFNMGANGAIERARSSNIYGCQARVSAPDGTPEQPGDHDAWGRPALGGMVWIQRRKQCLIRSFHRTGVDSHTGCCRIRSHCMDDHRRDPPR
jgi:ammonium transporter, Amt family